MRYIALTCSQLTFLVLTAMVLGDEPADPEHAQKMAHGLDLFKREVRQVLVGRCVRCHGGKKVEGEFDLTTREGLLKGGAEGKAVLLGKSKASRLYKLITHEEEPEMPEDGAKLNDLAIAAIAKWIDLGAPYDKPLVAEEVDPLAWTRRKIDASARDFWSFQPLRDVSPPRRASDPWCRTDVDLFIHDRLLVNKLQPNQLADRRTLIRRAYFDLIGLPPTPAEVEAFMADKDPNAYEKLIDRLLESPHYGERWARHWLDVARFAESHGFEQDYDRPHAYHYRDFVIKAFNQDMPYDQFVRWQIAGDEIEPDNPLAMMATGFLGAGVFPTQLTEKEFEPARYDELDDMVATLGTSMLGLTIGCARCHDHKFDPIPSADYYRLVSTFATTIRSEVELDLQADDYRLELAKWQTEQDELVAARSHYAAGELPKRFESWLTSRPKDDRPHPTWLVLDLVEFESQGGATLSKQADGSLRASGTNPDFDKYTFVAHTDLTGITAIRLEALADKSLVRGGPGRAANGNMGLGNFSVTAQPLSGAGKPIMVQLVDPRATFQQNTGNLSIAASIDDNKQTGWAVDPQFGKDHAAVFHTAESIGFEGGTKLTFTLEFNVNNKHNIGRPRLSISTAARPVDVQGDARDQQLVELFELLDRADGKLSDQQQQRLLDWYKSIDKDYRKLDLAVQDHAARKPTPKLVKVMVSSEGVKPIKHHADGRGFPHFYPQTYFLNRGDANQKQGVAESGYLQVLMREPGLDRWQVAPPDGWRTSYRRRSLANWVTDTKYGAGQLLARVIVNRIWQHHLGRGIVATANDFGFQGQRPTHPELLDWLANDLIQSGWRLKRLHKLIMTSAVYLQASTDDEKRGQIDPDNRWYWRFTPRRLEAEIIRDSMLAVSGQLDRTQFGPGSLDVGMKRRSIYFMIKRSKLIPMMQIFDSPEPLVSVGDRPATTIAPQALLFMNNAEVRAYAHAFAKRVASEVDTVEAQIRRAHLTAIAREPGPGELRDALNFLSAQAKSYEESGVGDSNHVALTDYCQVLMGLNEFLYVD